MSSDIRRYTRAKYHYVLRDAKRNKKPESLLITFKMVLKLFDYISILLTGMLNHGYSTNSMMVATILPTHKDKKKSLNISSNYRGIALSSILAKVLEWAIMSG